MASPAFDARTPTRNKHQSLPCITCGGATIRLRDWTESDIRQTYALIAGKPIPNEIRLVDYEIIQCRVCRLIFADPPVAGSAAFYDWIASIRNYYPADRWEWQQVAHMLSASSKVRLLEVGCGIGNFLGYISSRFNIDAEGLDINRAAVAECKARGLRAYNVSLQTFARNYTGVAFDIICAYHCLEHVEDPKAFVASMERILAPDGRIILSVPYSPTSSEIFDWDCLNLPPHHITRWNKASLQMLGTTMGMATELETDESTFGEFFGLRPILWRFIALSGGSRGKIVDLTSPFLNPLRFMKVVSFATTRERTKGKRVGETALVTFRRS